jgi:AcrR family transcriptional regulator
MPGWQSTKSRRRADIVAAARTLMRRAGPAGFSMRVLAEEAGVSIATPYNLFGSKQAVLLEVLASDLKQYEAALAGMRADEIEVLFRTVEMMAELFAQEPALYRSVIAAVSRDGGPELRFMVSGPRYLLWKRLLREATDAGLLRPDVDPDAFAITVTRHMLANVLDWAQGNLSLAEMTGRIRYGLALSLQAIATDSSREQIRSRLRDAERSLQRFWRTALATRLQEGPLDPETRAVSADQLLHVEHSNLEESAWVRPCP